LINTLVGNCRLLTTSRLIVTYLESVALRGVQNATCLYYNLAMADDLSSKFLQGPLADTVAWCRVKAKTMDVKSDEVRRRQASYNLAEQQWIEAIKIRERRGLQSVAGIKEYQHAVALLMDIRNLLGPMDRILRSPELKPRFSLDQFGNDTLWAEAVEEVVTHRAKFLAGLVDEHSVGDAGGRLLLYSPSENLACGAADASSNGFFDTNNVPPWDIWLGFSNGMLVSWVPPALVDVAAMGVFVNPEECIRWADSHYSFINALVVGCR
jgi:hypothetical protein